MEENLQFDKAEFKSDGPAGEVQSSAAVTCSCCKTPLFDAYFQAGGNVMCGTCAEGVRQLIKGKGSRSGRFMKALIFGGGAAILGSVVYYAISAFTGYEFAIIAILLGILVGKAVRAASGNRGGWRYQVLAAALTYMSIASAYIPPAIQAFRTSHHSRSRSQLRQQKEVHPQNQATPMSHQLCPR
jgi:hypothetical protein